MHKYVEFHVVKLNNDLVDLAIRFGYSILIVESIDNKIAIKNLLAIPRRTSNSLAELKKLPKRFIRVYRVSSKDDLKNYPRIRKYANAVMLSKDALLKLGHNSIRKIYMLGLPVEMCFRDLMEALNTSKYLRGLNILIKYLVANKVELVLSSCSEHSNEFLHPAILYSTLEELGVSDIQARKALTQTPLKIIRSVGYAISI